MPIPVYFVNGQRFVNPSGGEILVTLDPPFPQHMTIELLVHCVLAEVEIRHSSSSGETRQILIATNRDTLYLTVEPGDKLTMYLVQLAAGNFTQGSLYAFR